MTERMQKGLTVTGLARAAKVAPNTIADAERGRRMLTDASAQRLAEALGIDASGLIDRPGQFRPSDDDGALRRRRHELCLSSREAAARIGVARSTLLSAEAGARIRPHVATLIAEFYNMDMADVVAEQQRNDRRRTREDVAA